MWNTINHTPPPFSVPLMCPLSPEIPQAQCCELEQLRLVDGTVTDDSDAFAFGGRAVYKNIFNERKYVEAYLLPDAEKVRLAPAKGAPRGCGYVWSGMKWAFRWDGDAWCCVRKGMVCPALNLQKARLQKARLCERRIYQGMVKYTRVRGRGFVGGTY